VVINFVVFESHSVQLIWGISNVYYSSQAEEFVATSFSLVNRNDRHQNKFIKMKLGLKNPYISI
jgi:hypothetical protein